MSNRMPLLFIGHGSPMNALEDNPYARYWRALAETLPWPKAILCLSAHFAGERSLVVDAEHPETIHDFWGFPEALHAMQYPAPGSPALADRVCELFPAAEKTERWGLDHGAWSVLCRMWPEADIPVVQLSLNLALPGEEQLAIGRALVPLREEGVLLLGSGNVAHNLRRMDPVVKAPFSWARQFDEAVRERVLAKDYAALAGYMDLPGARESVPTTEHFVPLLYVLGAADDKDTPESFLAEYVFGSLSMTGFKLG